MCNMIYELYYIMCNMIYELYYIMCNMIYELYYIMCTVYGAENDIIAFEKMAWCCLIT